MTEQPDLPPVLPQSLEIEKAILGEMCVDAAALEAGLAQLSADAFMAPANRIIFAALGRLHQRGDDVDFLTLRNELSRSRQLEEAGGVDAVVQLGESVASPDHAVTHIRSLLDLHRARQWFMFAREIQQEVTRPDHNLADLEKRFGEQVAEWQDHRTDMIRPAYIPATTMIEGNPELRQPIIEGLLRRGEVMNVIAPPKLRKSWLVLNLLLSVASGRHWLHFPTYPGRCLLIDNELHAQTLARRIPRVMQVMDLAPEDIADRLFVESLRGRLCDIYEMAGYFNAIKPGTFDLIVLDAWYRFQPKGEDENSNAAICAAYNQLDRYAAHLDCCFVVIHHASKGVQTGKAVTDVGAGAGAQARAADAHLILREHAKPNAVVLEAAVRSWPPVEPIALRWEFPTWTTARDLDPTDLKKPNHSKRRREKTEQEGQPSESAWTASRFASEILTAEPTTKAAIIEKSIGAGLTKARASGLLAAAECAGQAHRIQKPKDNRAWYSNQPETTLGGVCVCVARPPTPPSDALQASWGSGVSTQIETVACQAGDL
ncbi:MAG: AAA family ATPase [Phycisphaerae bacterium]|nr:AAA family ATPase [Phycisphaerae bacterium]